MNTEEIATPYDWGISKYVGLLEDALKDSVPMFDYQQTLDTLKVMRGVWLEGYEAGKAQVDHCN